MSLFFGPIEKEPTEIFNYCTKYLIRERSNESSDNDTVTEGWRFPLVMTVLHENIPVGKYNEVTFIYQNRNDEEINSVEIIGSFLPLYQTMPLEPVLYKGEPSDLYYLTLKLPVGNGYHYRYLLNGNPVLDPINPQRINLPNGKEWSFFFTDYYNSTTVFEEWELNLLHRLVEQITPFRSDESQNFINRFYQGLSQKEKHLSTIYKLDDSVGEVNYITNILAREERHHLLMYKTILPLIDQLLRKRNPYVESWKVPSITINELYEELANDEKNRKDGIVIPGWDYSKFDNPTYFLKTFRRHCIIGAFCHPRYGGNIGCAGWDYVKDMFPIKDDKGQVVGDYFNWELAIEPPHGRSADYRG